jgi:hypothetical protein
MKTRTIRFLNIALAFTLLVSMQVACGTPATETPVADQSTAEATEAPADDQSTAQATEAPVASVPLLGEPGTWLVMMYEDGDDEVLEEDIVFDVNEAESIGSTDTVKIVAQLDRFDGAYDGDGDWTSTKRYLLNQDDDLYTINSPELEDLGEVDMGDPQSLYDFAAWAMTTYPAEHYVLIMSDHGAGWNGGWSDADSGSGLSMQEIDDALGKIIADTYPQTGVNAFELVGFDACLMGQLEVMSSIAPHAKFAIGSEETEPSLGWAYASFLTALNENPGMTGGELGQVIVDGYISQDVQVAGNQSRAKSLSKGVTLTTVDLGAVQGLNAAVNELAVALTNIDQEVVSQARAYAQSYTSIWWDGIPPSYIDLGHFTALLLESTDDPDVTKAAQNVQSALAQSVVAEKHGAEKPGSTGLTIFFPNSELYEVTFLQADYYDQYTAFTGRFATASVWDDFLTYFYTGQPIDPAAVDLTVLTPAESTQTDFTQAIQESAPEAGAEIAAPSAGPITIAPITVSASEIGPDGKVTISTEITGSNIAYVYYFVSYWNEEYSSYLSADQDFIFAEKSKEIGGVTYPDWGNEGVIPINYEWEPTLYYMSDGNEANDQFAFFMPTVYGADANGDIYTVRGTYTFLDTGTEMTAEMDFDGNGDMKSVWGFTGDSDSSGAWSEITPNPGDTFTITNEWLEYDKNPDGEFVDYPGGVMTFGDTPFKWSPYYAYSGYYSLAIGVEDLDGNTTWEFTEVTVTE